MIVPWLLVACAPKIDPGPIRAQQMLDPVRLLVRPELGAPNLYLAAQIAVGSASDPVGSEGLASLTAHSLVEAGAGERTSEALREALYPTASRLHVTVEREWTTLRLTCHRDHAALCVELFVDTLVKPRFDSGDVLRVRDDAVRSVTDDLLSDQEELGLEVMEASLYEAHPYGHPVQGRAGVLPLLSPERLRAFHDQHYVREAITIGLAGSFDEAVRAELERRLVDVPARARPELVLSRPMTVEGRSLVVVSTDTPVTGIHLAQPISLDRDHPDWPAMFVATTALGSHRQSFGRLYRSLRADRGLNYGDYAYIEPYVQRGYSSAQDQATSRKQNRFLLWIRPTSIENGPFALKLAVAELEDWVTNGLEANEFENIRAYLKVSVPLLSPDPGRRLLYALDAAATGEPDLPATLPAALDALTLEQTNAAIQRYVDPKNLRIVVVTGDALGFVRAITEETPTPIVYAEGAADASRALRDAEIASRVLGIPAHDVVVIPAEGVFR